MKKKNISACFNFRFRFRSTGKTLNDYTLTLTRPDDFHARLTRWLKMQGDDVKGNAEPPRAAGRDPSGHECLSLRCTEETALRVERQFSGEILSVTPPAEHQRGTIYPPKVDPWDVSRW